MSIAVGICGPFSGTSGVTSISRQSFLQKHEFIHKNQFGFQRKSGTLSAVAQLITKIEEALDNKHTQLASAIFIDLKKAFDTVPHIDVLEKKILGCDRFSRIE